MISYFTGAVLNTNDTREVDGRQYQKTSKKDIFFSYVHLLGKKHIE